MNLKEKAQHLLNQNKYLEASKIYSKIILENPDDLDLLNNFSSCLINIGKADEAKIILSKILKLDQKNIGATINLGVIYKNEKDFKEAKNYFLLALEIQPNIPVAHYNLGTVYEEQKKFEQAINQYTKTIEIKPSYIGAHYNLGCVLDKIGKTYEAILSYKQALLLDPNHINARYNLGINCLATDDFKNGWIGYEFRRGEEIINYYEKLGIENKMIWDGKQFEGNLIIHAEQGLGEEIMFSSMFEELLNYPSNLYVSASIRLMDLFRRSFPQINFIKKNDNFKFKQDTKHLLAGSLGKFFRNSINDFKNNERSWLIPNNQRVKEFSNFFNNYKKIKVGLAWKSAGIEANTRNIYLEDLAKIFSKDKFEIINLQYGDIQSDRQTYEQKESRELIYFENLDYTNDLEGLVALIFNCDLVVTIGGFTASLAGSLGIPSWVLPPASTTWCWHSNSNRIESLWYPKMKFFRQKKINEWEYVFNLIKNEIKLKFY